MRIRALKATALVLLVPIFSAFSLCADETAAASSNRTNLLANGSFEKPIQWGKDWTSPQTSLVSVVGNASDGTKCIHMKVPAKEAAAEGVVFLSEFVPAEPGGTYRIHYDLKGTGPTVIVFVEAYDPRYIGRPQGDYRKQCDRVGPGKDWKTYEHFFRICRSPKSTATISKMQVKVFAYYPEGEVWVDNIVLHPITQEEFEKATK